jgi:hypothetical protein
MSTPFFFLSYARAGDDEHDGDVEKFYDSLVNKLRVIAGLKAGVPKEEIGFIDRGMRNGTVWPKELARKLGECRTLLCLYSPAYFKSDFCKKEFTHFRSRVIDYERRNPEAGALPFILTVLWVIPKGFPQTLPSDYTDINYDNECLKEWTKDRGLYFFKDNSPAKYSQFVSKLAREIFDAAEPPRLKILRPEQINLLVSTTSLGEESISSNVVDATTPPHPWRPTWLQILTASGVLSLIMAGAVFFYIYAEEFRVYKRTDPPIDPHYVDDYVKANLLYPEQWSDEFYNSSLGPSGGKINWKDSGRWDLEGVRWELVPGLQGNKSTNKAILVGGTSPGVVISGSPPPGDEKYVILADFTAQFSVQFVEGTRAGWLLRAQGSREHGFIGYYFVLEKPDGEGRLLHLYARLPEQQAAKLAAQGKPSSEFGIEVDSKVVGITQYGKKRDDRLTVTVTVKGNVFSYSIQPENPDETEDRGDFQSPALVTVSDSNGYFPYGTIGFFAGDEQTRFNVENLIVYPL